MSRFYIVTGGAGFIGSAFVVKLNSLGIDHILVVDSLGSSERWRNLSNKRIYDYLDKDEFLRRITAGFAGEVEAVIHLGACSSTTEANADYMMENNYRYSKSICRWALENSVRCIYASSAATYGDGLQGFSDEVEDIFKLIPLNVYALSKQLFDIWAICSGALDKVAGLKFFNVYGPNEYHKGDMCSVAFKSFKQIESGGKITLFKSDNPDYADGEQKRDFVYVKDCADILWWLLENPAVSGIYNIGTGKARSWNDLAQALFSALDLSENERKSTLEYVDMPAQLKGKYQYFTQAEVSKLRKAGYTSEFTSLESGIEDYVKNYLIKPYPYL